MLICRFQPRPLNRQTAKFNSLSNFLTIWYVGVQAHVTTDAFEGEGYKIGVELVGGHAVDEEGEVFQ